MSERLSNALASINASLKKDFSDFNKLGKACQKYIDKPLPYTNRDQLKALNEFYRISHLYDLSDDKSLIHLCIDKARLLLIEFLENFDDGDVLEKLDAIQSTHLSLIESDDTSIVTNKFKMSLIPILDYLEGHYLRRTLIFNEHGDTEQTIRNSCIIPPELVGFYLRYLKTNDKKFLLKLTTLLYKFGLNPPSFTPVKYLEDDSENTLSHHLPRLSYYLNHLLMDDYQEYKRTTLENYRVRVDQMTNVDVLFWKNICPLNSKIYDYCYIEKKLVDDDMKHLVMSLLKACEIEPSDSLEINIQICIRSLRFFKRGKFLNSSSVTVLSKYLRNCHKYYKKLQGIENIMEKIHYLSSIHTELGYMKLMLNNNLPMIDPLIKKNLKRTYCLEAITTFDALKTSYEATNDVFSNFNSTLHPYHGIAKNKIDELQAEVKSLEKFVAVREDHVHYESLLKVVEHGFSTILSVNYVKQALINIDNQIGCLIASSNHSICLDQAKTVYLQYTSVVKSYESLLSEWSTFGISYPDIIDILVNNLSQFVYGLKMKLSVLKKLIRRYELFLSGKTYTSFMENLLKFPVLDDRQPDYFKHIGSYLNDGIFSTIPSEGDKERTIGPLLLCAIQESFNLLVIEGKTSRTLKNSNFTCFNKSLNRFIKLYNLQQLKDEIREKEEENLYKVRTKCDDLPEEEQIAKEMRELFPNYLALDFCDIEPVDVLEDPEPDPSLQVIYDYEMVSYENLKFVAQLHTELVRNYANSEWLCSEKNPNVKLDFVQPLVGKSKMFKFLLDRIAHSLDYKVDLVTFGSYSVLLHVAQHFGDSHLSDDQITSPSRLQQKNTGDFYKDSNVEEVLAAHSILEGLKQRINELLQEWPEQPMLMSILTVIERLYSFEVTNPISRFLCGFEILLRKCHEWEQVAHSGVSLGLHSQNLMHQVISWRKRELAMWKDLLNLTFERFNDTNSKWWFYMFNVFQQFVFEKEFNSQELITTLQEFIKISNIGEFQSRIDLLYTFHCYSILLVDHKEDPLVRMYQNILWNVYSFFKQFSSQVSEKIKELKSPIDKKLKDYVKIVKWKDISYWSVKETIDKSHKVIHKHVREFKEALSEPVLKYLTHGNLESKAENVGIWDRPQRHCPATYHYTLDSSSYLVKKKSSDLDLKTSNKGLLPKIERHFEKSRKLCKQVIEAAQYPVLVQNLEGFLTEIIETSDHMRKLEVDGSADKKKQRSQAKSILQQKHRVLSDLFKNLNHIGVSYRSGIVYCNSKITGSEFAIKPVDLNASLSYFSRNHNDEKILTIWDGCEMYCFRQLMRFEALEAALRKPAPDMGMHNVERFRGYTANLIDVTLKLKREIVNSTRHFYCLRTYFYHLSSYMSNNDFMTRENLNNLQHILKHNLVVCYQYKIILNACPEENAVKANFQIIVLPNAQTGNIKHKNDENWVKVYSNLNEIIDRSNKLLTALEKYLAEIPSYDHNFIYPNYVAVTDKNSLFDDIDSLFENMKVVKEIFKGMTLDRSIIWLNEELRDLKKNLFQDNDENQNSTCDKFEEVTQNYIKNILIVIQKVYQKYVQTDLNDSENAKDSLQENLVKILLADELEKDIKTLDIEGILKYTQAYCKYVFQFKPPLDDFNKRLTSQTLSLLDQLIHLYQYFITQQVSAYRVTCKMNSILLNIFIELITKGFCVPPEFSEEFNEEGISKPTDGLGLGEGEGERDVSDKIESEDQLENAQPSDKQNDEDKEEDPSCEENENGIEMSEDFDSKLQDKTPNEDEENEESDTEADEQMGETEDNSNKLDEEIWGSDEEYESEGEEDDKEDQTNSGKQTSEPELGAKEKESRDQKQEEKEFGSGDKKEKEINEMEEPEYDEEQVDPYHGKQPELPEPEDMDLPDDLQLDDGQDKENDAPEESNPLEIDEMKDIDKTDEGQKEDIEENTEKKNSDDVQDFSSDEENVDDIENETKDENIDEGKGSENTNEEEQTSKPEESSEQIEEKNEEIENKEDQIQSALDTNKSNEDNIESMDVDNTSAQDNAQITQSENMKSNQPNEELNQEDNPDKEGVGQSQIENSKTGHSASAKSDEQQNLKRDREQDLEEAKKPGDSNSQRSLGDTSQPVAKKLKTLDSDQKETEEENNDIEEDENAEMYKHIRDSKEKAKQVLDMATEDQAEQQKPETVPKDDNENTEETADSSDKLPEEKEELTKSDDTPQEKSEKFESQKHKKNKKAHSDGEILENAEEIEIEGDKIETSTAARGAESSYHTHVLESKPTEKLSVTEINEIRQEVTNQLTFWNEVPSNSEVEQVWQKISAVTSSLAQDLSEKLRLILEPTQASKLKGDFRTGRRINMRKVIPYIASQFRKDKIWMRRTKPSKREYQIVLAIDDSSSMADNRSKELAFESVALISKALTLLESGQLSVLSFGEQVNVIHKLTDQFTEKSGIRLLQKFGFNQNKTNIGKLVNFTTEMFEQSQSFTTALNAKLLVIVSDGRGVFSEGESFVRQAVRRGKLANIFTVFVIIDNPDNKDSVLDIRMPLFKDGKLLGIQSYMDSFPFSFYIILRDIASLPNVLSDALRQWFEMVINLDT